MRGKAVVLCRKCVHTGITPAYAGKSETRQQGEQLPRDHPRLCGEKWLSLDEASRKSGSPPPMRGKVLETASLIVRNQDHPRLCGEKVQF